MKRFLLLCSLLWTVVLFPQSEAANWYFGYGAGIKFNQQAGTVTSLNDGRLVTNEGCASISDSDGQLLFYTDGSTVYNKEHEIMQNGTGLLGDASSSQSAIIAPKPNDPNVYYIFTVDNRLNGSDDGLNYSVVDITLDGGLGAITSKNINLLQFCSEKITVVQKNCVTGSLWLVTFSSVDGRTPIYNTYHAFEINDDGVSTTSIKSTFIFPQGPVNDIRGYLVLSPDGKKLASANMSDGLFIYDFNATNGVVSNQQQLFVSNSARSAYGLAFSPNNQLLYVHSSNDYFNNENPPENNNPANHYSVLTQFNMAVTNIQNSATIIHQGQLFRGALQLGPNGKIYRAMSATYQIGLPYLAAINNPNEIGTACNYQNVAINLSPNDSAQGLPPFIQSLFNTEIDIIQNNESSTNLSFCEGDSYTLIADVSPESFITWYRDGQQLQETGTKLEIDSGGHYEVYIEPNNGDCPIEGEAYVNVGPIPESVSINLIQCDIDGSNDGVTYFNLEEAIGEIMGSVQNLQVNFYSDFQSAEDNSLNALPHEYRNSSSPQIIYARVQDPTTGCYSISEVTLESQFLEPEVVSLTECDSDGTEDGIFDFNLKDADGLVATENGLEVSYYRNSQDALLENNQLSDNYINESPGMEQIYARIENENSCWAIQKVNLIVNPIPDIETEAELLYCLNSFPETITLDVGLGNKSETNFTYKWSTGETTSTIEINDIQTYTVEVFNSFGCSQIRTISVLPSNTATITQVEVEDVSNNNSISVIVSGEGDYEYSLDNTEVFQEENLFDQVLPGLHTIYVRDRNGCGIIEQLVSVIGFPKFFTPNEDGSNDTWQVKGISPDFQSQTTVFIYDRYGKLLKKLAPLSRGWDGKFNGLMLPTSDYWFRVRLEDGREFTGHFTLKR